MTAGDFFARQAPKKEGRVKGAKRTDVGGISFDSKREARRWGQLNFLLEHGEIRNLRRQVPIDLMGRDGPILTPTGRRMKYKCDFVYEDSRNGWATVYEDAKGFETEVFKMKRAILAAQGIEVITT